MISRVASQTSSLKVLNLAQNQNNIKKLNQAERRTLECVIKCFNSNKPCLANENQIAALENKMTAPNTKNHSIGARLIRHFKNVFNKRLSSESIFKSLDSDKISAEIAVFNRNAKKKASNPSEHALPATQLTPAKSQALPPSKQMHTGVTSPAEGQDTNGPQHAENADKPAKPLIGQADALASQSAATADEAKKLATSEGIRGEIKSTEKTLVDGLEKAVTRLNFLIAAQEKLAQRSREDLEAYKKILRSTGIDSEKLSAMPPKDLKLMQNHFQEAKNAAAQLSEELSKANTNQDIEEIMHRHLTHTPYPQFLEDCTKDYLALREIDKRNDSLYIAPAQRMPRHVMLLSELQANSVDKVASEALKQAKAKAEIINQHLPMNKI